MRIAVDARPLGAELTGIGRYTTCLLQRLVTSGDDWFLYSDRPIRADFLDNSRVIVRHGDASGGTPGSLKWAQWQYVKWSRDDDIEVFWSPRHHLPLCLGKNIRTVVTAHDLVWRRFPETMQWKNLWLERCLFAPSMHASDAIICVSNFTASEVSHYYPRAKNKCRVIHAAADLPRTHRQLPGVPEQYFLFVGTFEPRKNLRNLLVAYADALRDVDLPPLVLVGGRGWGSHDLHSEIVDRELSASVVVYERPDDDELKMLYKNALGLIMPSLYEGFGLPALEAMQQGVPVIASNRASLPEVVGEGGILVDPLSTAQIGQALVRLWQDESERQTLSEKAIQESAKFSWETAAAETLRLLRER